MENHAARLEREIRSNALTSPVASNQIDIPEILELEKASSVVYVASRDLPYTGQGLVISNDFLGVEADGVVNGRYYVYLVGKTEEEELKAKKERFMTLLHNKRSDIPVDKFREMYEKYVRLVSCNDPYRPIFSWALHKIGSVDQVAAWVRIRFAQFFHSFGHDTWIGHICISLPEQERYFLLMPRDMLERSVKHFELEFEPRQERKGSKIRPVSKN